MKKTALLLLSLTFVSACAVPGAKRGAKAAPAPVAAAEADEAEESSAPVDLFSAWEQDNTTFRMDFTGGNCGTDFLFSYRTPKGAVCKCTLNCAGGTSGGSATMSMCTYQEGSTADKDPGCATLNAKYIYTNHNGKLSFTNVATQITTTYHAFKGAAAPSPAK